MRRSADKSQSNSRLRHWPSTATVDYARLRRHWAHLERRRTSACPRRYDGQAGPRAPEVGLDRTVRSGGAGRSPGADRYAGEQNGIITCQPEPIPAGLTRPTPPAVRECRSSFNRPGARGTRDHAGMGSGRRHGTPSHRRRRTEDLRSPWRAEAGFFGHRTGLRNLQQADAAARAWSQGGATARRPNQQARTPASSSSPARSSRTCPSRAQQS